MVTSVVETALAEGLERGFGAALQLSSLPYPSRFAGLLASFLRRYTVLG